MHPPPPFRAGPVAFEAVGKLVKVRAPRELAKTIEAAGGVFDPGDRTWWLQPRRLRPLVRRLERETDPLFRQAGLTLE
jgi:hypothetical protein